MTQRFKDDEHPLVFVSCGQFSDEERALGHEIAKLISDRTAAHGYFAENQASFEGVSDHILSALDRCVGFVGVMHHRGVVSAPDGSSSVRASVWIEQEIAIAAYIVQVRRRPIPVQLYIQKGIRLEGLREKILLNAVSFESNVDVLSHFRQNAALIFANAVAVSGQDPIIESPLGPKPFPQVSLTPSAINPDFIVGAIVRPASYLPKRRILDSTDEELIEAAARSFERAVPGYFAAPLSLKRVHDGVVLLSEQRNEKRQDGSTVQPDHQIQIDSDGDMTFRFMQDERPPMEQMLRLFGAVYFFTKRIYVPLGLRQRIRLTVMHHLHAGRNSFVPLLPTDFRENADIDLERQTFVEAFAEVTLQLFRVSNYSSNRDEVLSTLASFWNAHLAGV